jgi:hypothetical protein
LIVPRSERARSEFAAFPPKLASIQFGSRANLVRNQFESGLDSAHGENRNNERGCPMAISIGRRSKLEQGEEMNIKAATITILLLLAAISPATAKKNQARLLFLETPVTMNGAEIPRGIYELTLQSDNSSVRVTLWKNGQFVATAPGVWAKSGVKYTENALLLRVNSDGSRTLTEIRLADNTRTIVLKDSGTVLRSSAK